MTVTNPPAPTTIAAPPAQTSMVKSDNQFLARIRMVKDQIAAVHQVMRECMKDGVHYGVIPGTEKKDKTGKDISKPVLLQPGADILM